MNRLQNIMSRIDSTHQTYFCLVVLVCSVAAYLYFLNVSVVHVVMRKEATQEQNRLRTEIAMLETSYIEAQHKIADRIADLEGYSTETDKIFITRGETGLVLRDN
ncbi:MAG: hypothetical protein RLZZ480_363 [Candidatus Parcubacteria bacterium]|jgi:hypothetical protein